MIRSIFISATGIVGQQRNVEVISNNIANMQTTAYTRRRVEFQDLLYQTTRRTGSQSNVEGDLLPAGTNLGNGVRVAATYRVTQRGNILPTDNTFDLAIQGRGYFQVDLPGGVTGYTRAGALQLNDQGEIVTPDGYTVQPGITIPDDAVDVTINQSGEVLVALRNQVNLSNVGQIELASFVNENGLLPIGQNLFLETASSGTPTTGNPNTDQFGPILQGFLETANVDPVKEIGELITAQRAYEMNTKAIQTADDMYGALTALN